MSKETKQLLQEISLEKITKEQEKKLLHEINTEKMVSE
jgi:hypothetical protein